MKVKTGQKARRREPFFSLFLVCTADWSMFAFWAESNRPGLVLSQHNSPAGLEASSQLLQPLILTAGGLLSTSIQAAQ